MKKKKRKTLKKKSAAYHLQIDSPVTRLNARAMTQPGDYQHGYLKAMDKRSAIYVGLSKHYNEILIDLGGFEGLSKLEIGLIDRLVFIEFQIRTLEVQIIENVNGDKSELMEQWTRLNNAILSICNKIGCQKRRKGGESELDILMRKEKESE